MRKRLRYASSALIIVKMVKGWIRGQGEFNMTNKNKLAWSEIWQFFGNYCEARRAAILCVPFCKVYIPGTNLER